MDRVDDVLARVREAGGRVTSTKRAVVTVVSSNADAHLTAEQIAEQVLRNLPDSHISTVYRILHELEDLGIVRHVHLGHGPSTYHLAADHHHHAVCESCGVVVELPSDLYDDVAARISADHGFELDVPHFALAGRCRSCATA
ncbi:MAG TPA: transcriptional repressor [Acidimicrobiales bacterium]|nr:transcriptional repressor [Acidimicrobiales bacterium]